MPSDRFIFALAALPGVGRRRLRALVQAAAGADVVDVDTLGEFLRGPGAVARLRRLDSGACARAWEAAGLAADTCARRGWTLWVLGTPNYPAPLLDLADPPALLFVDGHVHFDHPARVAIVGTREPSTWGEGAAAAYAREAVRLGAVVVSGLAWGVDTAAHRAVVDAEGVTWAALPGGLDIIFPGSNRALAERIVAGGGALVSEYPPGTRPHPTFFVERDRLQAALSQAVLVVETGTSGGTMHTVRFARELGRPIGVTWPPEVVFETGAHVRSYPEPQQGVAQLRQSGAPPVDIQALAEWLHVTPAQPATPADPTAPQPRLFE